jgi:hypothetical protein
MDYIVRTKENNKTKHLCKVCDYSSFNSRNFKRHLQSDKHNENMMGQYGSIWVNMGRSEQEKKTYFCEVCNYKTIRKDNFDRHCSKKSHHEKVRESEGKVRESEGSEKWENNSISNSVSTENYKIYQCDFCNKEYKYTSGLSKHKKKCKSLELQQNIDAKLSHLTNENESIKTKLDELATKPYTVNNTMNNTVNIETFLNTECSGAMDFLDFIRSLTITTDDIKRMGKTGFIKSYSELVTQKIKDMDIKDRPAHCTNKRQMFFFIKHKDIWTDDKEFEIFNKSINLLKDKECEAWYNYSLEEREKNYVSDADVNSRADAISELAKMNDESLFTKIIKQASKELFLSKKDI